MRSHSLLAALATLLSLTGCHSAYIAATISNRTSAPLALVELDYPSASFGTQSLAPGADYHYRFKVLGNGPTTVLWTDSQHQDHKAPGPTLQENDEGILTITFTSTNSPAWSLQLLHPHAN